MSERVARIARTTKETDIDLSVDLDGTCAADVATGIGFFDHMLTAFGRHGLFDLKVRCKGDLEVDGHHSVEDTGIVMGQAFAQALGDKRGIRRFGDIAMPMDEALIMAAVDISGRGQLYWDADVPAVMVGAFDATLAKEFFIAFAANAGVTLYTVGILKTLPGIRKYVAIDGGMSDNIRTALYHADYEPVIANKAGEPRTEIVTLCGKHCESGDAVVIDMPIQHPEIGDIACVFTTGAYCSTMSSNYNGQPKPAVVFVKDGVARVVTRRETYADLYARDI